MLILPTPQRPIRDTFSLILKQNFSLRLVDERSEQWITTSGFPQPFPELWKSDYFFLILSVTNP